MKIENTSAHRLVEKITGTHHITPTTNICFRQKTSAR